MNTEEYTKSLIDNPKSDDRLISQVEGAGGDVKLNKRKLEIAEKQVHKKANRGRSKPTFKKGGIGIIKKRIRTYEGGGTSYYKNKIYDSYEEARNAMNTKISDWGEDEEKRIYPYYGEVITEGENIGKRRVQKDMSMTNPRYSTFDSDVKKAQKQKQIENKRRQILLDQGYIEGEDF